MAFTFHNRTQQVLHVSEGGVATRVPPGGTSVHATLPASYAAPAWPAPVPIKEFSHVDALGNTQIAKDRRVTVGPSSCTGGSLVHNQTTAPEYPQSLSAIAPMALLENGRDHPVFGEYVLTGSTSTIAGVGYQYQYANFTCGPVTLIEPSGTDVDTSGNRQYCDEGVIVIAGQGNAELAQCVGVPTPPSTQ